MSLFPFHRSCVSIDAPPAVVFEALSEQIEPVSRWLTRYTEKPFYGEAVFPNARVQLSRFAQRWVVIQFRVGDEANGQAFVASEVSLPPLAKAALVLLAVVGVILTFVVLANAAGLKDLWALLFPPVIFMGARTAMLSDFNSSKLASENLQLKLSARFSALAPNHHMSSDETASGLAGYPER